MRLNTIRTTLLAMLIGGTSSFLPGTGVADTHNRNNSAAIPDTPIVLNQLRETELKRVGDSLSQARSDRDDASYALGVRFYRTLAKEYTELSYLDFLSGVFEAKEGKVTMSRARINEHLETAFMSRVVRGQRYLNDVVKKEKATPLHGIYFDELVNGAQTKDESPSTLPMSFENACLTRENSSCVRDEQGIPSSDTTGDTPEESSETSSNNEKQLERLAVLVSGDSSGTLCSEQLPRGHYRVAYARIDPIDSVISSDLTGTMLHCISVTRDEVIRGWRTALDKMSENDIWDITVPPELAYGTEGVSGGGSLSVMPDEPLRFIIALINKPESQR